MQRSAKAPYTSPQKEYGYRNGQLLITAGTGATTAPVPSALAASPSSGGGNVVLSWTAASGAANYRVERKAAGGSFTLAVTTASTGVTDTGVSAGSAYLYRVCAANGQGTCTSDFSNIALGAAISFPTDPTITSIADDPTGVNVTKVKAAHITELRTAVNAVRSLAGQAAAQWTNQTLTATLTVISADDVRDLRTKLDEALTALGIQTSNYDDQTLSGAPNGTLIKKVHITQLRQRATSGTGGPGGSSSTAFGVQWLIADQLGTPRIILDQSGSLASTTRHDYLPFGEELNAGGRTAANGYTSSDTTRQKFTGYEHDGETGLDYAHARYYANAQGRFTGVDPISGQLGNPQSFNGYAYVGNNPVNTTDPSGMNYFDGIDEGFYRRGMLADQVSGYDPRFDRSAATGADQSPAAGGYAGDGIVDPGETPADEGNPSTYATVDLAESTFGVPQNGGPAGQAAAAVPQSATDGRRNTVIVTYSDGSQEVRSAGSRSWRNNNPGNIRRGANLQGEIGAAGGFTVFTNEASGQSGIVELLGRPGYQRLTVGQAIARWAPPNENDTAAYQRWAQNETGIPAQTQMNGLNANQLQSMANAIRRIEGWTPGVVTFQRPRR